MDYIKITEIDNGIKINGAKNFNPKQIFDCGQCFRWEEQEDKSYIGVAMNKVIRVEALGEDIIIHNTNKEDFYLTWEEYFDLKRDYSHIKMVLSEDPLLKEAVNFGNGIRLLKQDPFEMIISFIISSNNRIPMIKKVILNICEKWGEKLNYEGKEYYTFPTIERLHEATLEELQGCSAGFRAKYIKETTEVIYSSLNREAAKEISCAKEEKQIFNLQEVIACDDDVCHVELQKLCGIGPKVADCIMLFSMEKYSAFPVDVWVKRAMQHFYLAPDVSLKKIREFGREKFGNLSGFAQQYLFYYARENHILM